MKQVRRHKPYIPAKHSLALKVIEYLQANVDEELTRTDIAKRYDVQASIVDGELSDAVRSRWLSKARSDDGVVYRLVSIRTGTPQPFAAAAAATKAKWLEHHRAAAAVDPSKILIERDVPLTRAIRKADLWDELFKKMAGQNASFCIPAVAKCSVSHAFADFRKRLDPSARFAIRKISSDQIRVWRTA